MELVTFDDLLAMKLKKEDCINKVIEIEIPRAGKVMKFTTPKENISLKVIDEIGTDGRTSNVINAYKKLIYHSCPMLQDTKLHERLGTVDPYDVVSQIFEIKDILYIGDKLFDYTGVVGVDEEIKN